MTMKSLIIVESFTKTKTIKKYLNDPNVTVTFSCGHICNLPKDSLGINVDDWTVEYQPTNKKIINTIRHLAKEADIIYLASDPDLEGEAIAKHLKLVIHDLIKNKACHRITFNEITRQVIVDAINNPRDIDENKIQAQETRRIVDRLIGYKISPILWSKFNLNYLSAGRVQLAGLITCINQRNKILNKEIVPYWTVEGKFNINDLVMNAKYYKGDTVHKFSNANDVKQILDSLKINSRYDISYDTKNRKTSPPAPYTTTTMQQDAYNKFKFNTKLTMKLAQDLYENGLITYMRTDSTHIAEDAKKNILNYVKAQYGDDYGKYRTYKTKIVNAQEAHEAIRITNPSNVNIDNSFAGYTSRHGKLYDMIWKRTLSCLMIDAEYIDVLLTFAKEEQIFKTTQSFLVKEGFLILYEQKKEDYNGLLKKIDVCNKSSKGCFVSEYLADCVIDNIPSMYNEVQLIKELEKEGIGRPSTYASIIDKLLEKKYVMLGQNPQQEFDAECFIKKIDLITKNKKINLGGKQKDLLIPTDLGLDVTKYLYELAPYLCDLKFTSKMEQDLDDIISQKTKKESILNALYQNISATLETANTNTTPKSSAPKKEHETGIIKTRYGYCYYQKDTNQYTNIEPYLKWKKMNADDLSDKDMTFIKSLPKCVQHEGKMLYLNLGKYGLYLKDKAGNNHKLEKKLWSSFM